MNAGVRIWWGIAFAAMLFVTLIMRSRGTEGVTIIGPSTDRPEASGRETESEHAQPVEHVDPVFAGVPVGAIVAWAKAQTNTPALPRQWVECNGQKLVLSGSPYDGTMLPNLNGAGEAPQRFLRGALQDGDSGGAEIHQHGRMLIDRSGRRTVNVSDWISVSHLPPYYDVVWIMKVAE